MQNAECRMQNAECRMQNAKCKIILSYLQISSTKKIVNDEIIFVPSEGTKAQPTLRSESRRSLLILPSREEEKPAKQD